MLEQKVGTVAQQKKATKILVHNFTTKYKKVREDQGRDALLRRICDGEEEEGVLAIITFPNLEWVDELKASYST